MTTPEDRAQGTPGDRPVWGQQPAGGWGDAGAETRAWGGPGGAVPGDPPSDGSEDATRVDQARPGEAPPPWGGTGDPQAPGWAQQPPPGAGWAPPGQQQWGGGAPPPQGGQWSGQQPGWGAPGQGPQGTQYTQGPYAQGQYGGQYGQGQYGQAPYGQGPQGQGPWGPGYPPLPGAPAPRRRSRVPLVVAGVVVALLVVGAVLAFVTPGFLRTTVFDQAALQAGVQRVLTEDYRYTGVGEVRCGTSGEIIRVREGAEFTCSTTIDGAPATIPVRVTSNAGDYEVSRPL